MSFVVMKKSLPRADPTSRGIVPLVVCLCVISKPQQLEGLGPNKAAAPQENLLYYLSTASIDILPVPPF
jgi:hypothetical protein